MKKAISLILAALLSLSLFAACGGGPEPEPETKKSTTGMNSFEITYFYGPQTGYATNRLYWELAKEAGFTSVPIDSTDAADNKIILGYLRELGLTCSAVSDSRLARILSRSYSDEEIEKIVGEVIADYADYNDVIKGWWLKDEPGKEGEYKKLNRLINVFRKLDPERPAYVNLLPYEPERFIWATDLLDPQFMSADYYPFYADGSTLDDWFTVVEAVRKTAISRGIDYMMILQLSKWGKMADLTYSQILWETNAALCYGMKRISYFTYMNIGNELTKACIDENGNKSPHFDMVKEINAYSYALGSKLFNKDSTAVFHLVSSADALEMECVAYESYGSLGKVTGDEFAIGFFSDGSFMIMNKRWKEGAEGNNALIFDDVASGLEYFDVESASWKAYNNKNESGKYVYNAEAGEALLFRVK